MFFLIILFLIIEEAPRGPTRKPALSPISHLQTRGKRAGTSMHSKSFLVIGDWTRARSAGPGGWKPGWSEVRSGKEMEQFGSEGEGEMRGWSCGMRTGAGLLVCF